MHCLTSSIEKSPDGYSFTLTINDMKKVYFKGKYRPYGSFSNDQQYELLEKQMLKCVEVCRLKNHVQWVYELHEPTVNYPPRLHIHGYMYNVHEEEVRNFISEFYTNPIRIAYGGYIKLSKYERTYYNENYFLDYMQKHQHEIKYYMSSIEDKKMTANLDGKKFNFQIESNINAHYLNSLDDVLESRDLGDEYRFGKLNKFLVEL